MRIRLDRTICDGFGVCAKHAPKHFSLDDWGYASLIGDGSVEATDRDDVLRALFDCPVHAIIEITDESDGQTPPGPASPDTDEAPVFEARWGFAQ
ncbi:ferredoxin [Mycobacterium sp. shizuoka-1]|uniref:ferredoxin n=1 Tax=Mycobacterium sp. shizuoka-1 TaxID=2039281 RepID=UPI0018EC2DF4|nr:ferredoxin [Mycobacterium sp. shizuoka-1]